MKRNPDDDKRLRKLLDAGELDPVGHLRSCVHILTDDEKTKLLQQAYEVQELLAQMTPEQGAVWREAGAPRALAQVRKFL